jgi:AcrR family transcriptional regulator
MSAKRAKPKNATSSAGPSAADSADLALGIEDRALDAALRLAATRRWTDIALGEIAAEAGLTLGEMLRHVRSKSALLASFSRRIDEAMLATPAEADGSVKDRLFELLMRRFDALGAYRDAVQGILDGMARDPATTLCQGPALVASMRYLGDAAGVKTTGVLGPLKINALAAVYLCTLRVWLKDDSADAAKTMADLDKKLGRLESWTSNFPAFLKSSPT